MCSSSVYVILNNARFNWILINPKTGNTDASFGGFIPFVYLVIKEHPIENWGTKIPRQLHDRGSLEWFHHVLLTKILTKERCYRRSVTFIISPYFLFLFFFLQILICKKGLPQKNEASIFVFLKLIFIIKIYAHIKTMFDN